MSFFRIICVGIALAVAAPVLAAERERAQFPIGPKIDLALGPEGAHCWIHGSRTILFADLEDGLDNAAYTSALVRVVRAGGHEVSVEGTTLTFKKPEVGGSTVATLEFSGKVMEAKIRAQTAGQMTKVIVRASDGARHWSGQDDEGTSHYSANAQAEVDEVARTVINDIAHKLTQAPAGHQGAGIALELWSAPGSDPIIVLRPVDRAANAAQSGHANVVLCAAD
jgi:hypothetical protein